MDIRRLSRDGHSYYGIRGYSDMEGKGGHPWTINGWSLAYRDSLTWRGRVDIHGLSMDGHSYSQLSTKQLCPSMDGRGLSTAPLDISVKCVQMKRCAMHILTITIHILTITMHNRNSRPANFHDNLTGSPFHCVNICRYRSNGASNANFLSPRKNAV